MSNETFDNNTPTTPCPPFCVMHHEGRHVGELEDPKQLSKGYTMYTRPFDLGDGKVGMQIIVLDKDGKQVDIEIPQEAVLAAANEHEEGQQA